MASLQCDTPHERGGALVTALVLVALMSAVAIAIMDTVRFASRASVNLAAREQARLYALGAEQLAAGTIASLRSTTSGEGFPALDEWVRTPVEYPITEGTIAGEVGDGANCFNLNSLVTDLDGVLVANPAMMSELSRLLTLYGLNPAQADELSATIADWIDSDNRPGFGGAEDPYYVTRNPPYRTPGQLLVDISELKLMRGVTADIYQVIHPVLCARPTTAPSRYNVNTLQMWQAPLMAAALGERVDVSVVERFLTDRPLVGFYSLAEALVSPSLTRVRLDPANAAERFSLASEYYDLRVTVTYREAAIHLTALLQISPTGTITTASRHYGSVT